MHDQRGDEERAETAAGCGGDPSERARRLYAERHRYVLRFFRRQGFDDEDARELTQEAFLRVSQNIEALRSTDAAEVWLRRIMATVWKNEIRRLRAQKRDVRTVPLDDEDRQGGEVSAAGLPAADAPGPERAALGVERLAAVLGCMDELPAGMRRCLVLYAFQERQYKEIAEVLHLSIETVKSHIHQARRQLKVCLGRRETRSGA